MDGTLPAGARHDLTDEQWLILAALLPGRSRTGRPRRWTLRQLIDGIRFRTRTGCPWRDVPERYGSWQSVYGLFRAWQLAGRWAAILTGLQALSAEAGLIEWVVSVDSTVNRAHQHAAGARRHPEQQKEPPVGEPADHALGRSRGGLSTKVHLASEQGRKTLATTLTGGQAADSPQFIPVLGRIRVPQRSGPGRPCTRPNRVLGDKAYSARANRTYLRRRGIPATIPVKADQQAHRRKKGSAGGRPPAFDSAEYRKRHAVECGINRHKQHRGFATRYDKLAVRYDATVHITNINIWLRDLSNRAYAERTRHTVTAWKGMNGQQGGDPAKLARALVQLTDSDEPPLRWAAGADAVAAFEQKAQQLLAQADAHRDLSSSLAHDDA